MSNRLLFLGVVLIIPITGFSSSDTLFADHSTAVGCGISFIPALSSDGQLLAVGTINCVIPLKKRSIRLGYAQMIGTLTVDNDPWVEEYSCYNIGMVLFTKTLVRSCRYIAFDIVGSTKKVEYQEYYQGGGITSTTKYRANSFGTGATAGWSYALGRRIYINSEIGIFSHLTFNSRGSVYPFFGFYRFLNISLMYNFNQVKP